eukprot:4536387-Prymnesium_polylepis.1
MAHSSSTDMARAPRDDEGSSSSMDTRLRSPTCCLRRTMRTTDFSKCRSARPAADSRGRGQLFDQRWGHAVVLCSPTAALGTAGTGNIGVNS